MNSSIAFARAFFILFSTLLITVYSAAAFGGLTVVNLFNGLFLGLAFALLLVGADTLFKRYNLRSFNSVALGLFFGYLMGMALFLITETVLEIAQLAVEQSIMDFVKVSLFLFATYIGMSMTVRASEEIYVSVPFVKFKPSSQKQKDILLDSSILADPRMIDLASSGLLDRHLVVSRFVVKELYASLEDSDENVRNRSRRSLDVLKKLEAIPALDLRFQETDFPEIEDSMEKLIKLARLIDANVLTADVNRIQTALVEGVRIVNIHSLSNSLKPIMQAGEQIKIKVQRYGKEAKQGVGYLEDGTMVVINGGGDFIGEVILTQVLSVKHTSSGRMIFCNALEERASFPQEEGVFSVNSND